ncbi:hypothetical protein RHGRI_001263 [Rhododendron griersonianum]|uniref:Uncharacterized protein n=1 Tax=Rhododendron griersonianum TaxID=479676 RepID=A0AAV6LKL6_9ERIC|nr:hypothetical protein RHGRI_001263 [Rhododendron griersonianum]
MCGENRQADALAKLASTLALPDHKMHVPICRSWVIPPIFESEDNGEREVNVVSVLEIETEDWRQPFIDYLQHGKLPDDPHRRTDVKRRAPRFNYYKDTLYHRSFEGFVGDGTRSLSCLRLLLLNPSYSMDDHKRCIGLLCMNHHVARMIVEGRIAHWVWLAFAIGCPTSQMIVEVRLASTRQSKVGFNIVAGFKNLQHRLASTSCSKKLRSRARRSCRALKQEEAAEQSSKKLRSRARRSCRALKLEEAAERRSKKRQSLRARRSCGVLKLEEATGAEQSSKMLRSRARRNNSSGALMLEETAEQSSKKLRSRARRNNSSGA